MEKKKLTVKSVLDGFASEDIRVECVHPREFRRMLRTVKECFCPLQVATGIKEYREYQGAAAEGGLSRYEIAAITCWADVGRWIIPVRDSDVRMVA